jgi:hypothetical protein
MNEIQRRGIDQAEPSKPGHRALDHVVRQTEHSGRRITGYSRNTNAGRLRFGSFFHDFTST